MRTLTLSALTLSFACASAPEATHAAVAEAVSPDVLQVTALDGSQHDLSQDLAAGRPVALVFWQSWCAACLHEAPLVAEADRALGDRIRFVGVISGPDEAVDELKIWKAVRDLELDYLQVRDRSLALTRRFDVRATPTIVVLDATGRVAYQGNRSPESWEAFLAPRAQ